MRPLLIFDSNGTLLDVDNVAPLFARIFGSPKVAKEWFNSMVQYSQALTLMGAYEDFELIAEHALAMLATAKHHDLTASEKHSILSAIPSLPCFPEVPAALAQLRSAGFRLAVLTNSSEKAAETQMKNAGVRDLFDHVLGVDRVGKFKPAPETYAYAARTLGVPANQMMLIAAHPWDVLGATRAGLRGAFIRRPGKAWFGDSPQPEISGADLDEIAAHLLTKQVK